MSLNVLVVDDSPVMRRMVRRSLEMCGLAVGEVYEAGDGIEALTFLGSRWIDVVIADVNMPAMGGVEMVEKMARDKALARVPVVMVSSDRSEASIERLTKLGVRGYLTKPFRPEVFRQLMQDILPVGSVLRSGLRAEPTVALLAGVVATTLEECVFVLARPVTEHAWPPEVLRASMSFAGPGHGELTLSTSDDLGAELAASMLGIDAGDAAAAENAAAALGELTNIACGVLLERLFGRQAGIQMGLPEVTRGPARPHGHSGELDVTLVDDTGRGLRAALELRMATGKRPRGVM